LGMIQIYNNHAEEQHTRIFFDTHISQLASFRT